MKINQRLDYARLAEALGERNLVNQATLENALQQVQECGGLFARILVDEDIVSDWDLSRVVSEIFSLAFMSIDLYEPDESARDGLDERFLRKFMLVPLDRFDSLLTVAMPGMVTTDVLTNLGRLADAHIIPVVGTVNSNRRWLEEHVPAPVLDQYPGAIPGQALGEGDDDDWASMFDEADAAVRFDITPESNEPTE